MNIITTGSRLHKINITDALETYTNRDIYTNHANYTNASTIGEVLPVLFIKTRNSWSYCSRKVKQIYILTDQMQDNLSLLVTI